MTVERTDIHHERRKDMADEMNKSTPVEEEIEIITLTDENGEDMDFEFLDQIDYEGKRYAVLMPPPSSTYLRSTPSSHSTCE